MQVAGSQRADRNRLIASADRDQCQTHDPRFARIQRTDLDGRPFAVRMFETLADFGVDRDVVPTPVPGLLTVIDCVAGSPTSNSFGPWTEILSSGSSTTKMFEACDVNRTRAVVDSSPRLLGTSVM